MTMERGRVLIEENDTRLLELSEIFNDIFDTRWRRDHRNYEIAVRRLKDYVVYLHSLE